jgi:hypothetical protein
MSFTGGRVVFMGKRVGTLYGEPTGDVWMVVRYPSHRAFLRMISNPWYLLVCNRFRERGTARLELAFTQPRDPASPLHRQRWALGVHAHVGDEDGGNGRFFDALASIATDAGLEVVYASELRADLDLVRHPRPVDPNRLTHPTTAAIGGGARAALRGLAESAPLRALLDRQRKACAQLYRRGGRLELVRFGASTARTSGGES